MAIISFFMLPEPGHLNGPLKLAKLLKAHGHKIYFFGLPDSERYICHEEIEFIPVLETLSQRQSEITSLMRFTLHMIGQGEALRIDLQTLLIRAVKATISTEEREPAKQDLDRMFARVKKVQPDLFFADYNLLPIAFMMSRAGINSAIMNPTLFESPLMEGPLIIDFSSILKLPVVHLCPREFDLPRAKSKDYPCYFIEPSVDLNRKREEFPWNQVKEGQPLLFCSFGSQSRIYSVAKKVIQTIVDTIAAKPEWEMILSLNNPLKAEDFSPIPPNALLLNMAPQLEVLKRASLMITHGGLNSIKECIFFGVPMIVIPFDKDQPLNAVRVEYHGLGLMGSPATISVKQLRSMIERIEKDPSFKTRVEIMRERFREVENSGVGVKTIEILLSESSHRSH